MKLADEEKRNLTFRSRTWDLITNHCSARTHCCCKTNIHVISFYPGCALNFNELNWKQTVFFLALRWYYRTFFSYLDWSSWLSILNASRAVHMYYSVSCWWVLFISTDDSLFLLWLRYSYERVIHTNLLRYFDARQLWVQLQQTITPVFNTFDKIFFKYRSLVWCLYWCREAFTVL